MPALASSPNPYRLGVFFKLTKVDEAKREVWGRATEEVVDKANEIFDYATSKPFFEKWSQGFSDATDGKSLGNIRSMHGKVAAGKVINIDFNDAEKAIDIGTKIVDENEWNKVLEGVHTGFSIGGSYKKKWKDPDSTAKRFTADPVEISLVDSPCVPTAKFFDVIKADGVIEQREFKKGMYTVQDFASILCDVCCIARDAQSEAEWEGDSSPIPESLKAWLKEGVTIFQAMAMEESEELCASMKAAATSKLQKAGAKFSASMKTQMGDLHKTMGDAITALNSAHQDFGQLGWCCDDAEDQTTGKALAIPNPKGDLMDQEILKKAEDNLIASGELLTKANAELTNTKEELVKVQAEATETKDALAKVTAELEKMKALPADTEGKGVITNLPVHRDKDNEVLGKQEPAVDENDPVSLMKAAHRKPKYLP